MKLVEDYLGDEIPIFLLIGAWPHHIDCFKKQYKKAFARYPLFGEDLMDLINKRVHVFLRSCNTTAIEDVELGGPRGVWGGFRKR